MTGTVSADAPVAAIAALLHEAGVAADVTRLHTLRGGNNKVWRVETAAGRFIAKAYFRQSGDPRDRQAAEFAFARYAQQVAPGRSPRALALDADAGLSLFEFVAGEPPRPGEVGDADVQAAASFFAALNPPQRRERAADLPDGAEACFSIDGHLALVAGRIGRLREGVEDAHDGPTAREARDFVAELSRRWDALAAQVRPAAVAAGLDPATALEPHARCVSPSDFGFHNALRGADGTLRFVDFEHAGWDDPAKMAGDFFAQLAVPAPPSGFESFIATALATWPQREDMARRCRLLRPVYQFKWCCIAMNVFLPAQLARRRFADPDLDVPAVQADQLGIARRLLDSIPTDPHGLH